MDGFRVIRDFGDFSESQRYGYETATNQGQRNAANARAAAAAAAAPWHNAERLGEHAFKNPYEDFGTLQSANMGQIGMGPVYATGGGNPYVLRGATGGAGGRNKGGRTPYDYVVRGDGGVGGGGRYQQNQQQKRRNIRREHVQYPYVPVPDSMEHKTVMVTGNSAFCFHGYQSLFTLQHRFDFVVEGQTYKSVDQYYQLQKVKDLAGISSAKFTDGSTRDYSTLARELLRQASIKRPDIENWRTSKGVVVIQKALLEKVRQCYDLRSAITSTGDKIIVQSFAGDDFYGSGVPAKFVKDWCTGLEKNKSSLKFPMFFPLTENTIKYVPVVGKGKNVLGAIYMIIREKINAGQLDTLSVEIAQASGDAANMDFTADSNS